VKRWHEAFVWLLLVASALGLRACSSLELLNETDLERAKKHFPSTTMEQLHSGRDLYARKCGACHILHPASKMTLDEWQNEITKMKRKVQLDEQDVRLIEIYLSAGARDSSIQ